jgi:hypothetical protein
MALKVKTAKNSKLPKMSENCFEPVGKGGWPPISIWIIKAHTQFSKPTLWNQCPHSNTNSIVQNPCLVALVFILILGYLEYFVRA